MDQPSPDPLARLYAGWIATMTANPAMTLDEIRGLFEHWGDVTGEPGGVDYSEGTVGGVEGLWARPHGAADRTLLCFHGGGYALGSRWSHRKLYGHFAKAAGCAAFIAEYRRAPENYHPGPVNDCTDAYAGLLKGGADPADIAFIGDSAGGALAIATLLNARERGLPLPAGAMAMAPYLDLEAKGETYVSNDAVDVLGAREATLQFVEVFLGPNGNRHDPLASPLYADLAGLPPIFVQTGGDDVLLDDSRQFAALAQDAGVAVTLEISPGQQHVFQFLAGTTPAADAAVARGTEWLRARLRL
jgi:monoterpene epsilon-lactone hydrolase